MSLMQVRPQDKTRFPGLRLAGLIVIALALAAYAQQVVISPQTARPGQDVTLTVSIPVRSGFHLYSPDTDRPFFATSVNLVTAGPLTWRLPPRFPPARPIEMLGRNLSIIDPDPKTNTVRITIDGTVKPDAPDREYPVTVSLTYQACSDTNCLIPVRDKKLFTKIIVDSRSAQPAPSAAAPDLSQPATSAGYGTKVSIFGAEIDLRQTSLLISLLIAFVAGAILNVMPCVLPVIPIKILQLVRDAQEHRRSVVSLGLTFCLGIIAFFLAIALAAVALQGTLSWGQHFQSPLFLAGTSVLLVWLALGMLGVYQIQPPAFIATRSPRATSYLGAFSMGLLAGVLSTPCSFGLLGGAVAWAQTQPWPVTLIGFGTIGLGMAGPYLVLAARPGLVRRIPTAGRWADLLKQGMSFLLFAVAAFLIAALPEEMILATLLYCLLFAFVVWLWGQLWQAGTGAKVRLAKICAVGFLVVSAYASFTPEQGPLDWQALTPGTLRNAETANRTYLVEFTADWCFNCRAVEHFVFGNSEVRNAIRDKNVVLLRADLTEGNGYAMDRLKEWTGRDAPPFTVVFQPGNDPVLLPGVYSSKELIRAINDVPRGTSPQ